MSFNLKTSLENLKGLLEKKVWAGADGAVIRIEDGTEKTTEMYKTLSQPSGLEGRCNQYEHNSHKFYLVMF